MIKKENIISRKASIGYLQIILLVASLFAFSFLISESFGIVSAAASDVCCEKTVNNAWCQNAQETECKEGFDSTPTNCDMTSFCRPGCCYESQEGLCMENTPKKVCDEEGGSWENSPECDIPQCELGCCLLDNQAAFVTLTRCKRLSSLYGLETDFRLDVGGEADCIAITQQRDIGACVYQENYARTCKFTTRAECLDIESTGNSTESEFYKNYLCSAEELANECGMPSPENVKTTCIDGKDEVYFLDTCGNPANIYDASKIEDEEYWNRVFDKSESCNSDEANANSGDCGNCDYYLGSMCKKSDRGKVPEQGGYICEDLNCYDTSDGKDHRHGESWCSYDGNTGEGRDAVGSRHIKHVCIAGEEIIEECADFRGEICIENLADTADGEFMEAACRANRWRDCTKQAEKDDCENTARRDCYWLEGVSFLKSAAKEGEGTVSGACVPDVPPGFNFWEEGEAGGLCGVASTTCEVTCESGLMGGEDCTENEECLESSWAEQMNKVCTSLGDCGGYVNVAGKFTGDGYEWKVDGEKREFNQAQANEIAKSAGITARAVSTGLVAGLIISLARKISWLIGGAIVEAAGESKALLATTTATEKGLTSFSEKGTIKGSTVLSNVDKSSLSTADKAFTKELINSEKTYEYSIDVSGGASKYTFDGDAANSDFASAYFGKSTFIEAEKTALSNTFRESGMTLKDLAGKGTVGDYTITKEVINTADNTYEYTITKGDFSQTIKGQGNTGLPEIARSNFGTPKYGSTLSNWLNVAPGGMGDALLSGVQHGAMLYGIGQIIGAVAGLESQQTQALSLALGGGGFIYDIARIGFDLSSGASLTLGIVGGGIIFLMMYKKESTIIVTFDCKPWQAPTGSRGGNDCELCNEEEVCSEYRCKSLGQACKLLNEGTEDEKCAWADPQDTNSPVITVWEEVLTEGYEYRPYTVTRPAERGVEIRNLEGDGCVKAFTPLEFGINVSEPAQCKIDYNHTLSFEEMSFWFGESNLFLYNHSQKLALPSPDAVNAVAPELQHNGTYTLYVRCQDSNGNTNRDEFAIRFCVEAGPDTTAPIIEGTSIINGGPVSYNQTEVELEVYVNEPAECKWSKEDRKYDLMENNMQCTKDLWRANRDLNYPCKANLTGIVNREENKFFFKCKDNPQGNESDRNEMVDSYEFMLMGTQPLNILSVEPNETAKGSTPDVRVDLRVETANGYDNGKAYCSYREEGESSWIEFYETGEAENHRQPLSLTEAHYKFEIKCVDLGNNRDDAVIEFDVKVDQQAPFVARVYKEADSLKIVTTEDSECKYSIQSCNFEFADGIDIPYANNTEHFTDWSTEFTYFIRCADQYGNMPESNKCSLIVKPYNIVEQEAVD